MTWDLLGCTATGPDGSTLEIYPVVTYLADDQCSPLEITSVDLGETWTPWIPGDTPPPTTYGSTAFSWVSADGSWAQIGYAGAVWHPEHAEVELSCNDDELYPWCWAAFDDGSYVGDCQGQNSVYLDELPDLGCPDAETEVSGGPVPSPNSRQ